MDYRPTSKADFDCASKWVPLLPCLIFWLGAFQMDTTRNVIVMLLAGPLFAIVVWGVLRLGARLEAVAGDPHQ